jgi:hypothetical protein
VCSSPDAILGDKLRNYWLSLPLQKAIGSNALAGNAARCEQNFTAGRAFRRLLSGSRKTTRFIPLRGRIS